jgi:uridine kinase
MVDNVINTSSIYEIGVLKVILEPLLLNVPLDSEHYTDARRLLDSIRNFYPISSEYVSESSVLREFIGGSIYDVK